MPHTWAQQTDTRDWFIELILMLSCTYKQDQIRTNLCMRFVTLVVLLKSDLRALQKKIYSEASLLSKYLSLGAPLSMTKFVRALYEFGHTLLSFLSPT
jgi:hypothetical protein